MDKSSSSPSPQVEGTSSQAAPSGLRILPGDCWAELPREFRRLVIRDAMLSEAHWGGAVGTSWSSVKHVEPGLWTDPAGLRSCRDQIISSTFIVAVRRWLDLMEHLFVDGPSDEQAAANVEELRRRTMDGHLRISPDTLGELWPDLAELLRDGATGLLSLPTLPHLYASLMLTFAHACGSFWQLPGECRSSELTEDESRDTCSKDLEPPRGGIALACSAYVQARGAALLAAKAKMYSAEASGDCDTLEEACREVIVREPMLPEPYLIRSGIRLGVGDRWSCLEDVSIYLLLSTRSGFSYAKHVRAYLYMAEAYLQELEHRAAKQRGLMDDSDFHCFVDKADWAVHLALLYDQADADGSGRRCAQPLCQKVGPRHLLQRIEAHRAARRTAAEMLDVPLLPNAHEGSAHPRPVSQTRDYTLPWPIDLCAGLPDISLFSRVPSVGSVVPHDVLQLLFLDSRNMLDLLATLHSLAARTTAFASRNPENMHWKYRPKPVCVQVQAPCPKRLAHALLCIIVAKQIGTVFADKESHSSSKTRGPASISRPSFTMKESDHDRSICALFTSIIFCRSLTISQRAEVDRLLLLLIFASMSNSYMKRAFPWLDIDDGRWKPDEGEQGDFSDTGTSEASRNSSLGTTGWWRHAINAGQSWGTPLLLFQMQQIWIGWLATQGGEAQAVSASRHSATHNPSGTVAMAKLHVNHVHDAARKRLLGPRVATLGAAVEFSGRTNFEGLSQWRLWALTGRFASTGGGGSITASRNDGTDDLTDQDEPDSLNPKASKRVRWQSMLDELAMLEEDCWMVNPCVLDPVSWLYDEGALSDPFCTLSWRLRVEGVLGGDLKDEQGLQPWLTSLGHLLGPIDWPVPQRNSQQPLAVEIIWEHFMEQLKSLSSIFNTADAADMARARTITSMFDNISESTDENSFEKSNRRADQFQRRAGLRSVVQSHYRKKLEEVVETKRQITHIKEITHDCIERELSYLKNCQYEAGLDSEFRDYIALASMRKKQKDWWGKLGKHATTYIEDFNDAEQATWDPAPIACAPIRFRLRFCRGSLWEVAKAASCQNLKFDAINAQDLLTSEDGGIFGLCTWLDTLLKRTQYAYIQTRHCEELFIEKLRASAGPGPASIVSGGGVFALAEAAASKSKPAVEVDLAPHPAAIPAPRASVVAPVVGGIARSRGALGLIAAGATCPPTAYGALRTRPLKPLLNTSTGQMQWSARLSGSPPTPSLASSQATFRSWPVCNHTRVLQEQALQPDFDEQAVRIQAAFRGYRARCLVCKRQEQERLNLEVEHVDFQKAAAHIHASIRGWQARNILCNLEGQAQLNLEDEHSPTRIANGTKAFFVEATVNEPPEVLQRTADSPLVMGTSPDVTGLAIVDLDTRQRLDLGTASLSQPSGARARAGSCSPSFQSSVLSSNEDQRDPSRSPSVGQRESPRPWSISLAARLGANGATSSSPRAAYGFAGSGEDSVRNRSASNSSTGRERLTSGGGELGFQLPGMTSTSNLSASVPKKSKLASSRSPARSKSPVHDQGLDSSEGSLSPRRAKPVAAAGAEALVGAGSQLVKQILISTVSPCGSVGRMPLSSPQVVTPLTEAASAEQAVVGAGRRPQMKPSKPKAKAKKLSFHRTRQLPTAEKQSAPSPLMPLAEAPRTLLPSSPPLLAPKPGVSAPIAIEFAADLLAKQALTMRLLPRVVPASLTPPQHPKHGASAGADFAPAATVSFPQGLQAAPFAQCDSGLPTARWTRSPTKTSRSSQVRFGRSEKFVGRPVLKPIPYTVESCLFEKLVKEAVTTALSPAQMQQFLGMVVRAEPLFADCGLTYYGVVDSPIRHGFIPWDSTLASMTIVAKNWPCTPSSFVGQALAGTRSAEQHQWVRVEGTAQTENTLATLETLKRYRPHWDDVGTAAAMGPRLLRLRRLSHPPSVVNHHGPPVKWTHKCSNVAFCNRQAVDPSDVSTGPDADELHCHLCECAWYCSHTCQAVHRSAHRLECNPLAQLRWAANDLNSHNKSKIESIWTRTLVTSILERMLSSQCYMMNHHLDPALGYTVAGTCIPFAARSETGLHIVTSPQYNLQKSESPPEVQDTIASRGACSPLAPEAGSFFASHELHRHTATAVVRLLSRWLKVEDHSSILRELVADGLFYYILTGLSEDRFGGHKTDQEDSVAFATHRMALHIAASRQWRSLRAAIEPSPRLHAEGAQRLECAQYSAYYAFLRPIRQPFVQLHHVKPVACLAYGDRARDAVLELPFRGSAGEGSPPKGSSRSYASGYRKSVKTFAEVATKHLSKLQLVDAVQMDALTGKVIVLLYSSVVEDRSISAPDHVRARRGDEGSRTVWLILLDAACGMQVIAAPLPARELRRCAL